MVKTREELINSLTQRLGTDTTDETISLLEDVTDTLADFESRAGENWKEKYEQNDREWREKYIRRFNGEVDGGLNEHDDTPKTYRYEDLFK